MNSIVLGTFNNNKIKDLSEVVETCMLKGFSSFDTAPSYHTETLLGEALQTCSKKLNIKRGNLHIIDKIDAWQMQDGHISKHFHNALQKLKLTYIDTLLIHWPIPEYMDTTWEQMEKLKEDGIVKNIGICNVRVRHMKKFMNYNIPPQVIQIERHPLNTNKEIVDFCKEKAIKVMAYSPLCRMDQRVKENKVLKRIALKYNKNVSQVILRWHIDTGVTPIFMSQSPQRITNNLDIFDFSLTSSEITAIESINCNYKIYLESWGCPGF